jgi:hypothetical protein
MAGIRDVCGIFIRRRAASDSKAVHELLFVVVGSTLWGALAWEDRALTFR